MSEEISATDIGKSYFQKNQFPEAIEVLNKNLSLGNHHPETYHLLGHSYLHLNQLENALAIFQNFYDRYPSNKAAVIGLAKAEYRLGRYEKSVELLTEVLKVDMDEIQALMLLMDNRHKQEMHKDVVEICDKLHQLYLQRGEKCALHVYHIRSLAYSSLNCSNEAGKSYDEIKELYPSSQIGYIGSANIMQRQGRLQESLAAWREALQLFPGNQRIIIASCYNLIQADKLEDLDPMIPLIEDSKAKANIYAQSVRKTASQSRWSLAFNYFGSMIRDCPEYDSIRIMKEIVQFISISKRIDLLDDLLDSCQFQKGKDSQLHFLRALICHQSYDYALALGHIDKFLETTATDNAGFIDGMLLKAEINESHGEYGEADAIYSRLIEINPNNYHFHFKWANSLKRREIKLATAHIIRAYELAPANGSVLNMYYHILEISRGTEVVKQFLLDHTQNPGMAFRYLQLLINEGKSDSVFSTLKVQSPAIQFNWQLVFQLFIEFKKRGDFSLIVRLLELCYEIEIVNASELRYKAMVILEAKGIENVLRNSVISSGLENATAVKFRLRLNKLFAREFSSLNKVPFLFSDFFLQLQTCSVWKIPPKSDIYNDFAEIQIVYRRKLINTYTSPEQCQKLAQLIKERIDKRTPTSLIRLGDGEGNFLPYPDFLKEHKESDQQIIQEIWWGQMHLSDQERSEVQILLEKSIRNADILGIPNENRIIRDFEQFERNSLVRGTRGILNVHKYISDNARNHPILRKKQLITSAHVNFDLNYWNLYTYILSSTTFCTIITCHSALGELIQEKFHIPHVEVISIPGEQRHIDSVDPKLKDSHYPLFFRKLMYDTKFRPGGVYLVAAGLLGKIYCNKIKESGGIALDIGALADYWIGKRTRSNYLQVNPIPGLSTLKNSLSEKLKDIARSLFKKINWRETLELGNDVVKFVVYSQRGHLAFADSKHRSTYSDSDQWTYLTFFYAYKKPKPYTHKYYILRSSNKNSFHTVLNSKGLPIKDHINSEFVFYAYPHQHELSHLQAFSYHIASGNTATGQVETGENRKVPFPDSFFPIKDSLYHEGIRISDNSALINRKSKPDISVVMSYYNRKKQLRLTLDSVKLSAFSIEKFEIIIVDDCSNESNEILDLIYQYDMAIKLVRLENSYKKDKNYVNPCIPYNIGFKEAVGEYIIIQNPEVCHVGDILSYTAMNLSKTNLLSFTCANLADPTLNESLSNIYVNEQARAQDQIRIFIRKLAQKYRNGFEIWYNHVLFRPEALHFLLAIHANCIVDLQGFSEKFAFGYGYDDNEFIFRIKNVLKLNIQFIDWSTAPFAIHQWHPKFTNLRPDFELLFAKNKHLFGEFIELNQGSPSTECQIY